MSLLQKGWTAIVPTQVLFCNFYLLHTLSKLKLPDALKVAKQSKCAEKLQSNLHIGLRYAPVSSHFG